MQNRWLTVLGITLAMTGCDLIGGREVIGSCGEPTGDTYCVEFAPIEGFTRPSSEELAGSALCGSSEFSTEPCPLDTAIGGCEQLIQREEDQFTITTWFYPGNPRDTEAEVRAACDGLGERFVSANE